jgi:hypothetical protein
VSSGFATASFVLSLQVWWSNPGRADLLGCGFGLAALGVLWRGMSGEGVGWRRAVGVGVLLGLTGLTHPTAGFFWGMVVAAQLLAAAGWRGSLRAVPAVGVGGVLGLAVWLPAILVDPAYWLASMRLLFGVKEALDRDFVRAAVNLGSWLFVWYPLPWILALAGGVVSCRAAGAWRSWPAALGLVFVVGWLNQCRTIEYYNTNAIPHFWAALCLLGGAGASALGRALSREGDRPRLRLAAVGGVWSLLLVGAFLPQVRSLGAVLATRPWVAHAAVGSALQRSIRPRDRVICATALFFDVPSTNRVSLWWYDRHDLRQANWVALTRPAEQMAPSGGRLADALTPGQMSVLRDEFCVVAEMPPSTNEAGVLARKHPLPGLYLYERRNRAEAVK